MGIGSEMFGMEAGLFVMLVNLQQPLMLLLLIPIHFFARWVYRKDHVAMKAYVRYMKEPDYYDPWVHKLVKDARPVGFGRNLQL